MTRDQALMQGLRSRMVRQVAWIKRATCAKDVSIQGDVEFRAVVTWVEKNGTEKVYVHQFTKPYVFGPSFKLSPQAWEVHMCAVEFARDIVRGVLAIRMG